MELSFLEALIVQHATITERGPLRELDTALFPSDGRNRTAVIVEHVDAAELLARVVRVLPREEKANIRESSADLALLEQFLDMDNQGDSGGMSAAAAEMAEFETEEPLATGPGVLDAALEAALRRL